MEKNGMEKDIIEIIKQNSKKNGKGKGKEYYYNGQLRFEGEYLKGKETEQVKNIKMMVN